MFQSKAQARYMFSRHPKMAKEFASKTHSIKSLPEKVANRKHQENALRKYASR